MSDLQEQCAEMAAKILSGTWGAADLEVFVRQFIAIEREACAAIAESRDDDLVLFLDGDKIAKAIRARKS